MPGPRVLVVCRRTDLKTLKRTGRIRRLVDNNDPSAHDLILADREHEKTLSVLKNAAKKLGIRTRFVHRTDRVDPGEYELVVTVGGDGTLLHASHKIGHTPVLAVNSSPSTSLGYLTVASSSSIPGRLNDAVKGKLRATKLNRMAISIQGRIVSGRVLNDALFCHACPASTTRYTIGLDGRQEEQVSSGVWISTPAGSTSASLAAGGSVSSLRSKRLQFVVREPNSQLRDTYGLLKGFVAADEKLHILNGLYHESRIYVDGPHEVFSIRRGQQVEFSVSDEPLYLLGFSPDRHGPGRKNKKGR